MGIFKTATAEEQEAKAEEKAERKFAKTPMGQARQAFADGDQFFQVELPQSQVKGYVAAMIGAGSYRAPEKVKGTDTLGAIAAEGWRLIHADWVFVQTGQESRDKFMASGQQVAIRGEVIGIYLFERAA